MRRLKKVRVKSTGELMYLCSKDGGYYGVDYVPNTYSNNLTWLLREEFDFVINVLNREGVEVEVSVEYNKTTSYLARNGEDCFMYLRGKKFPTGSYSAWVNTRDLDIYRVEA